MFSITTMASSTTMPVARTMAKSVSVLIEKPSRLTKAKAPISDTGMVSVGISVARQLCRNRNITRTTRPTASTSVFTTSAIDSWTTVVVSNAMLVLQARRERRFDSRASSSATPRCTSRALAVGSADDGEADGIDAPGSAAATSRSRRRARRCRRRCSRTSVAVGAGLDDDVLELAGLAQAAGRAHAHLVGLAGAAPASRRCCRRRR